MTNEELIEYIEDTTEPIDVRVDSETVWLSQKQLSELFSKDTDTIGLHLKNIYESNELDKDATTEKSSVVRKEGKRNVRRNLTFYNLDAIISVGYRVNSKRGIQFRIWATKILKDKLLEKYELSHSNVELKNTIHLIENIVKGKGSLDLSIVIVNAIVASKHELERQNKL